MAITNWNIPWINRKSWQVMTPAPTTTAAWGFVMTDKNWETWNALYVASATVQHWYSFKEELVEHTTELLIHIQLLEALLLN